MDGQISAESLIEALQAQRNEAMDQGAKLTAYVRSLEQKIQSLQEELEKNPAQVAD